jgi:hypothetical protein
VRLERGKRRRFVRLSHDYNLIRGFASLQLGS